MWNRFFSLPSPSPARLMSTMTRALGPRPHGGLRCNNIKNGTRRPPRRVYRLLKNDVEIISCARGYRGHKGKISREWLLQRISPGLRCASERIVYTLYIIIYIYRRMRIRVDPARRWNSFIHFFPWVFFERLDLKHSYIYVYEFIGLLSFLFVELH